MALPFWRLYLFQTGSTGFTGLTKKSYPVDPVNPVKEQGNIISGDNVSSPLVFMKSLIIKFN